MTPDALPAEAATGRGPSGGGAPPGAGPAGAANDLSPGRAAAPGPAASPESVAEVRRLQDDLRVLIQYVARRADRAVPPGLQPAVAPSGVGAAAAGTAGPTGQPAAGGPAAQDFHAGLLVLAPEEIARDGALLERLYAGIASLTRLAAPAGLASIRLTRAFLSGAAEVPEEVRAGARRLRRWTRATALFGLLVSLAAVALLVHVDRGRRAVQQLEQVRTEYRAAADAFAVPVAAGGQGAQMPEGCRDEAGESPAAAAGRAAQPPRASCGRLRDLLLRIDIVHRELGVWNAISERLSYASPVTWLAPRPAPVPGLPVEHWETTELRTTIMMASLTGFVLPMLLGLLGACVYVYRELDAGIEASTLDGREAVHGTLRMLLGAILGGLLGAIWTNEQSIRLDGVPLSLGAVAFFVGFGVEVVFRLVDALVRGVAGRIGKSAA